MTDTLPYIEVTENTPTRYRATHHPSGIELVVTKQTLGYPHGRPYYASLRHNDEWLHQYNEHCETLAVAIDYLTEGVNEILSD
jgi:hypothetical protein